MVVVVEDMMGGRSTKGEGPGVLGVGLIGPPSSNDDDVGACSTNSTLNTCRQLPTSNPLTSSLLNKNLSAVLVAKLSTLPALPPAPGSSLRSSSFPNAVFNKEHNKHSTTFFSNLPVAPPPTKTSRQRFGAVGKACGGVRREGRARTMESSRKTSKRAERSDEGVGGSGEAGECAIPGSLFRGEVSC